MKRTNHTLSSISLTGLVMFLLLWAQPLLAQVDVQLSRSTTSLEQPVRLKLLIEGENDASPDLSVLQHDFEILGRSTQQNVSIINGQMSKTQGLTLTLLPKQTGRLTIPPIPVGEETSPPLILEVAEAIQESEDNNAKSAFIQLELNKSRAYLQEEVILTVRLYQADGVRGESLTEPQTSQQDTVVRRLHEEQYQVEHEGQPYRVIEQRYAIFAYQTGRLQLGEIHYRGRRDSGGQSIFNLMRDPFNSPIQESRIIRATSEQVELDILPVPPDFTAKRWLPARNLQIVERDIDSNGPLLAGNPATRHIMVFADGLTSAQLPAIELEDTPGLKQYPERPQIRDNLSREGISGGRQSGVALIATEPGSYTLPAIEIPWWNTETDRQEMARLPAVTLEILPNLGSSTLPVSRKPLIHPAEESSYTKPPVEDQAEVKSDINGNSFPTWLVWTLGIGWLATLIGWWLSHRRKKPSESSEQQVAIEEKLGDELPAILSALELAYRNIDQEAARTAWLSWGQYRWPDHPPSNLNRLAKRCSHNIALAVTALDRAFYSPENHDDWREFNPRELLDPSLSERPRQIQRESLIPLNP